MKKAEEEEGEGKGRGRGGGGGGGGEKKYLKKYSHISSPREKLLFSNILFLLSLIFMD